MNKNQIAFEDFTFPFNPITGSEYNFIFQEWDKSANALAQSLKEISTCATRANALEGANTALEVERQILLAGSYSGVEVPIAFVDFSKPIAFEITGGTKGVNAVFQYEDLNDISTWVPIGRISRADPPEPDIDYFSFQPESGKKYFSFGAGLSMQSTISLNRAFFVEPSFLDNFPECNFSGFGSDKTLEFVENGDPERRDGMWQFSKNSLTILANNSLPVQALYFRG